MTVRAHIRTWAAEALGLETRIWVFERSFGGKHSDIVYTAKFPDLLAGVPVNTKSLSRGKANINRIGLKHELYCGI